MEEEKRKKEEKNIKEEKNEKKAKETMEQLAIVATEKYKEYIQLYPAYHNQHKNT